MSPLDATLIGLGGALGAVPGVSRVGALVSVSSMRGLDAPYGLKFTFMLMIPALAASCVGDLMMLAISGHMQIGISFFTGVLACIGAFGSGIVAIRLMRFLSVKGNYEGFAYYNWGLAMFAFIIYLIG